MISPQTLTNTLDISLCDSVLIWPRQLERILNWFTGLLTFVLVNQFSLTFRQNYFEVTLLDSIRRTLNLFKSTWVLMQYSVETSSNLPLLQRLINIVSFW